VARFSDFFCGKNLPFSYFNKKSQATWSGELFGKFPKKITKEESYEIAKVFLESSGRFLAFFFLNSHI
jgi:hypothetical protein